jgi:hypothetical protein
MERREIVQIIVASIAFLGSIIAAFILDPTPLEGPIDIMAAIAALVLAAAIATALASWLTQISWMWWITIFSALAAAVGLVYWIFVFPELTIKVTFPSPNARVEIEETILGESSSIPSESAIWVFVYSYPDGKLYPHEREAQADANGQWSARNVDIGALQDQGEKFDIIAVLANENGQTAIKGYIDRTESAGLEQLPEGVKEYDRVTVVRE